MTIDVRLLNLTIRRQTVLSHADAVELLIRNARTYDELKALLSGHIAGQRAMAQALHLEIEAIQAEQTALAATERKQRTDSNGSTTGQGIRGKLVN